MGFYTLFLKKRKLCTKFSAWCLAYDYFMLKFQLQYAYKRYAYKKVYSDIGQSNITSMSENFASRKFCEFREWPFNTWKNLLADSRKLIPTRHSFQIFLVIFLLLRTKKTGFLAYCNRVFVWGNPISRKLIPVKWIYLADSRN